MALKMTKEHQEQLREYIEDFLNEYGWRRAIDQYETGDFRNSEVTKNIQLRFIWDVFYAAVPTEFLCRELYPYLDDGNIYNAVKKFFPTLVDRRPADKRPAR